MLCIHDEKIDLLHDCNNYCTLKLASEYVSNIFSSSLPIARGLHSVQKSETESSIFRGVVTMKGGVCASMTGQAWEIFVHSTFLITFVPMLTTHNLNHLKAHLIHMQKLFYTQSYTSDETVQALQKSVSFE